MENPPINPMHPEQMAARLALAPRCGAQTRSGQPCRSPAVNGHARCRMHGGKRSGAPRGNRNAWKHGARSAETQDLLRMVRALATFLD